MKVVRSQSHCNRVAVATIAQLVFGHICRRREDVHISHDSTLDRGYYPSNTGYWADVSTQHWTNIGQDIGQILE